MSNSKKIASVAFTGAAATAATMMAAAPALAASHFSIKNGGTLYTGAVKGKVKATTTAVLVDTTKNTTLTCKKATFSGNVSHNTGSVPPAAKVGTVKKTTTTWSSCTGPFGLTFKAHLTTSGNVSITGGVGAGGATGKLTGNKISGKISGTGLAGACHATVSGTSVPAKYVNASHAFKVNSGHAVTLHVKSQANCLGAINTSDNAYFAGTYIVSVPTALTIS